MRRNVRLDLGVQGRGEHPPGRSPSRAISSRPAARLLAHLAIVPVELAPVLVRNLTPPHQ